MSLCSSSQNTFLSYLSPNGAGNLLKTGFYTFFYLSNLCARKRLRRGKIQSTSSGMCCAPSGFWRHHFIKGALLQHYLRQDILSMHYMPFPFFFHSEAGAFSDSAGAVIAASCSVSWVCGVGHQVPQPSSHPHLRHTGEQQDAHIAQSFFNNILLIPEATISHLFLSIVLFDGLNSGIITSLHRELWRFCTAWGMGTPACAGTCSPHEPWDISCASTPTFS